MMPPPHGEHFAVTGTISLYSLIAISGVPKRTRPVAIHVDLDRMALLDG
jgi:hypothetical protein